MTDHNPYPAAVDLCRAMPAKQDTWMHYPQVIDGNVWASNGTLSIAFPRSYWRPPAPDILIPVNKQGDEFHPLFDTLRNLQICPLTKVDVQRSLAAGPLREGRGLGGWKLGEVWKYTGECTFCRGLDEDCGHCGGTGSVYERTEQKLPSEHHTLFVGRDVYSAREIYRMLLVARMLGEETVTLMHCGYKRPCQFVVGYARVYIQPPPPTWHGDKFGDGTFVDLIMEGQH